MRDGQSMNSQNTFILSTRSSCDMQGIFALISCYVETVCLLKRK